MSQWCQNEEATYTLEKKTWEMVDKHILPYHERYRKPRGTEIHWSMQRNKGTRKTYVVDKFESLHLTD